MIQRVAVLLLALGLAACQSATPQQHAAGVRDNIMQLKADRDSKRISYTEWAERTGALAQANVNLTPDQATAIAYRTQLARRVDAGELNPEQFERESSRALQRTKANRQAAR